MACILSIETSTKSCSLVISQEEKIIFNKRENNAKSHASVIGVYGFEAMEYARFNNLTIDAIAVSAGPGSYTGLRIGVSEAKGLCYGLGIPLLAIPTLKIIVAELFRMHNHKVFPDNSFYCPMIDARRMEVYAALYDKELNHVHPVKAYIIHENSYKEFLDHSPVIFMGDGSGKCKDVINSPNALFVDDIYPTAEAMAPLALEAYMNREFVDAAYFEPFYLKEFQATVAKNKVIK